MKTAAHEWTRAIQTSRFRRVLWTCQALTILCLLAEIAFPRQLPAAVVPVACALAMFQFFISWLLGVKSVAQITEREDLLEEAHNSRQQIEQLFAMTDMLQSADNHEDAGAILEATARRMLPDFRGALYIFNNSRDRLDLATNWPHDQECIPPEALVPANCWALKRGKPHINDPAAGTLCCMHNSGNFSTIEVPMIARGNVLGLLMLATDVPDSTEVLRGISRIARALADSMSLALANIGLQEKLRTQSLRDPLTGLYNRRYMEDALDRYLNMAERAKNSTSVVMIDLDNFKKLNDTHGHANGDAVLRDVAGQLVGALRPSDVACRYGGEELLVILPNCDLEDALLKSEILRSRIEGLTATHGMAISASLGVASVPATSSGADVVAAADNALYAAKKAGRNCVRSAPCRDLPALKKPRLAAG